MVASSSPELMIGQVAAATDGIRVGSGGVMLPNHSPLRVAEQFKVLSALFGDRIDLGIGRAPGTDQMTAYALRRSRQAMAADDFPEQLGELLAFAGSRPWPEGHAFSHDQGGALRGPAAADLPARLERLLGPARRLGRPRLCVRGADQPGDGRRRPAPLPRGLPALRGVPGALRDRLPRRSSAPTTTSAPSGSPRRRGSPSAASARAGRRRCRRSRRRSPRRARPNAARTGPGRADDRRLAADRPRPARRAADAQRRRRADGDDERPRQLDDRLRSYELLAEAFSLSRGRRRQRGRR